MTKHSGKYDLYKVNADGTDPQLVLAGTGKESSDLHLVNMAESRAIFLASTREGKRNEEGSILYGLFQIDSATDEFEKVDESESIRMHGVSQGRLIYVKVSSGASAQNPERQKLISLDPITGSTRILASSNYFNSIKVTTDVVFYAPSDYYKSEKMPYLFRIDSITGDKTVVHSDEVWTIYRTGYDELTFDAKQDWYQVGTAPGSKPTALSGRPADLVSRLYQDNGVGTKSLLVDDRDGKGYLIIHDIASAQETTLHIQKGLKYPLRWIDDNHIVFRVSDSQEIADYIIDIRGGDPARVVSVSDVPSYDRWYYYY